MSAIVTFARNRIAYTTTKCLAREGIKVITCDSVFPAMTFFSIHSKAYFLYPSYFKQPLGFVDTLLKNVQKIRPTVLMPMFEETYILAHFQNKFTRYTRLPIPSFEKLMIARDKLLIIKVARELGIPVPDMWIVENWNDLARISKEVDYPLVIKPRRARGAKGVNYVFSKKELSRSFKNTMNLFNAESPEYPLVQEYVPGTGYGVSMLFNQGELRAKFVHKRIVEYPVTGGASVERVSTRHPKMEEYAERLLAHLEWHGVAMVEFKLDARTKKPVMMEVNPRFWGSLNQAVCAGVNFPYLLYRMAVDGDVSHVLNYRLGVKTRWFFGYARAVIDSLVKLKKPSYVFKNFLKFYQCNMYYDEFSVEDPKPFLMEPIPFLVQFLRNGELDVYESIDEALKIIEGEENILDKF